MSSKNVWVFRHHNGSYLKSNFERVGDNLVSKGYTWTTQLDKAIRFSKTEAICCLPDDIKYEGVGVMVSCTVELVTEETYVNHDVDNGLNMYLVCQTLDNGYDTFDSFVVVSESPEKALTYHPRMENDNWGEYDNKEWHEYGSDPDWDWDMYSGWPVPQKLEGNTTVTLVGTALPCYAEGAVICSSFNAG